MPDLKISQLPVASTPLAGTELVPIVQGGVTDQTTVGAIMTSTVPSGTANGVLYLNGSKVATSGSALTFDGTNFTTTGYAAGNGLRSLGGNAVRFYNAANSNWSQIIAPAGTGDMQFDTGAGEQMRLTSTGLGIGTSSPDGPLQVSFSNAETSQFNAGAATLYLTNTNTTNNNWAQIFFTDSDGGAAAATFGAQYTDHANDYAALSFATRGASGLSECMRLDSSGNLGIGTSSPLSKLVVSNGSNKNLEVQPGATTYLLAYDRTAGDYLPLDIAAEVLVFSTNNGTERMRLDASGNLGLGVTPSAWQVNWRGLQVGGSAALWSSASGTAGTYLSNNNYFNGTNRVYIANGTAAEYAQLTTGDHVWYTAPSGTAGNAISFTQALTLDASGQLLVGHTAALGGLTREVLVNTASGSAGINFSVAASLTGRIRSESTSTEIGTVNSAPLIFNTANTERARITSTGNVVAGGSVALATNATDGFLYVPTCAGTPTGTPTAITGMAPIVVDTTNNKMYFYSGGTWRDAGP